MQSAAKTVAAYLQELPADRRSSVKILRKLIKSAAPDVKESMQHGMPCYELAGKPLVAVASQKHYLAIYICQWSAMNKHRDKLGKTNCGKGCVRFRRIEDLSLDTMRELLLEAAADMRQSA